MGFDRRLDGPKAQKHHWKGPDMAKPEEIQRRIKLEVAILCHGPLFGTWDRAKHVQILRLLHISISLATGITLARSVCYQGPPRSPASFAKLVTLAW